MSGPSLQAPAPKVDDDFAAQLASRDGVDLVVQMAHDLRSPLTSILFLAESLQEGRTGPVNESQRRQLGIIYSAGLELYAAASDIVELTRGGRRLVDRAPVPFSVREVLGSVRDMVRPISEERSLPVLVSPTRVDRRLGHPRALRRVLLNLTTNALKFTERGYVEITATEVGDDDRVEFSVRDTGPGIDRDALNALYQPFKRTNGGTQEVFSRPGLGLAICRRLVEAMGASLELETEGGWGTRFSFLLRLPPAEPARGGAPRLTAPRRIYGEV